MSRKYKFHDSRSPHFVSFAVVNWIDLFTRREYFDIMMESLSYCIEHKGLIMNAWCIMTNHVHLIIRSETDQLQNIMRDMKKFTSKKLIKDLEDNRQESRKDWILWMFKRAGIKNSNNKLWQVWQQHNHPIELSTNEMIEKRLEYLHLNPVKAGFVKKPEDWFYSSARQYAGFSGILELEIID
ncbi:MAG: transposase [Balneolaceae bacterium]|nr:transposase [Balneolaceae bacterium]MDR9408244.1 transposase [Balneolaceae bacterium]